MPDLIYLASPYTHPDPAVMQERYEQTCIAAADLMRAGFHVFSPIAHSHSIAQFGNLPTAWEYWREFDLVMVEKCDLFLVLILPGWEESTGVFAEFTHAKRHNIRTMFYEPGGFLVPGFPVMHKGVTP
jgi:nucleoside 2-deoxyribosyltransferase